MKTFTINGKKYNSKPFDFNLICDLEDMGVPMKEMGKKQFSVTRAYFALCAGISNAAAGKELEAHVIAGNNFEELNSALASEMESSDFFRSLTKTAEEETTESQGEEGQKKAK